MKRLSLLLISLLFSANLFAADKFKVCWSIYVGWMPWDYAAQAGIVKKWDETYGIAIEVVQVNDYVESINQYTAGGFDGCAMTNMDALTIPAAGGLDSTALMVGDFSDGNDAVVLKGKKTALRLRASGEPGGTVCLPLPAGPRPGQWAWPSPISTW